MNGYRARVDGSPPRVIVIGAGMAGLAAAWGLDRAGLRVLLLERGARAGGRTAARSEGGYAFEAAPVLLTRGDRRLHEWIESVGLRDELLPLRPLTTAIVHLGAVYDADVRHLLDVRRLRGVRLLHALRLARLPRLLARYAPMLDPESPERAAALDDRSLADFCRLYFGRSVLDGFVGPRATAIAAGDPETMSRVQFLLHMRRDALGRAGLLRAGLSELVERVAARLPVQFETGVETLEPLPQGALRATSVDGRTWCADAVVLATPAPEAARIAAPLLGYAERQQLRAVRYAALVSVVAALRRPLAAHPQQVLVSRSERSPLAAALLEPGVPGGRVPGGRGLVTLRSTEAFAASRFDAPSEALTKELIGAFDAIWPGALRAVEFSRAFRVSHSAPRFDVGRYRDIERFESIQAERRSAGRRLYFAGDYLVHPSPEGAVVSARRAAAAAAADLLP
ncbi:MAG: FAD-dependent oxidoreductase [Myxococcales bacterium]|nr:FAD-dependent oxidoreductase [Myxococcales bacterium]MDH5567156.1 FAD-dependent oxidoreductase [Myxococcales bacterium]